MDEMHVKQGFSAWCSRRPRPPHVPLIVGNEISYRPARGGAYSQRVGTIVALLRDKASDGGFSPWLDRRDANLDHCVLQGRLGILREPRIGEIEVRTPKTSGRPVTSLEDFNFKLQSYRELKVP